MLRASLFFRKELKPYEHYQKVLSKGVGRSFNVFMESGKGSFLYDTTGKRYLDYCCGIGVTNLGHCHPRLVKVVQNQAGKLWHGVMAGGIHTAMADAVDEMTSIMPPELAHLFFCNSGAEAIEAAVRAARTATKRQMVVVLQGSYHGRTNLTAALTTSKYGYSIGCKPSMPGVVVVPPPMISQCKVPVDYPMDQLNERCLAILRDLIFQQAHPSEIAMLIAEPVMGEGAYLPLPADYLRGLRQVCDEHGILLCLDEVQSGYGRTGTMFNFEQTEGLLPDIMTFAKGVANGLPLAGIATTSKVNDGAIVGTQGGTYGGNASACASAAEVVRIFKEEGILDNVVARGQQLWNGLEALIVRKQYPIMEVRGRGLMIGLQFLDEIPSGTAGAVMDACLQEGLMILNTSKFEVLRMIPPLNTTEDEVNQALSLFEKGMDAALAKINWKPSGKEPKRFAPCCEKACFTLKGWDKKCRHYGVQ